jgi:PQQ-dependent catabolism-associated CXXCW motif protein
MWTTFAYAQSFAYEDKDWGVDSARSFRNFQYHAPAPLSVPGAKTIRTVQLKEMLGGSQVPILIDVLDGKPHKTPIGAYWLPGTGAGQLPRNIGLFFEESLATFTGGDKSKPLVFFCLSSECWLSYNASLRALDLGYTNVLWYRGGVDAWKGASMDMVMSEQYRPK